MRPLSWFDLHLPGVHLQTYLDQFEREGANQSSVFKGWHVSTVGCQILSRSLPITWMAQREAAEVGENGVLNLIACFALSASSWQAVYGSSCVFKALGKEMHIYMPIFPYAFKLKRL